ncbi:MAG: SDR family NAD(P)-dependent oxidoreductase [Paludibacteraceae bacterium]|nr:SDR family NAD(P)-dependent oxidoreductase [Paludibacteraceae bacterium]
MKDKEKFRYALVTGASSGIGYEFARQLAQKGYPLIIVSNVYEIMDCAKQLNEQYGVTVHGLVRDLGQQNSARELYDYCHEQNWEVEVLVNNAGVYHDKDILDDSEAFTSLIMNLHMYTPAMLCYLFGQDMRNRRKGYILNVCSVTSKMAAQRLGTYGGTKAFLAHFTRALHIELHKYGVHVTDVSPGAVDTGLYSIKPWMTKLGKCLGMIVSPETLARRGLRALFHGRSKTTIPTVFWRVLCGIILLIPTCLLRLIRRLGLF